MAKQLKKKPKKKLSPAEKAVLKAQRDQRSEITTILKNIGFNRLPYVDGKEFIYDDRVSEMDDIYISENIILITEYTIGDPSTHLLKKDIFYKKILNDVRAFIEFMLQEEKLNSFKKYYDEHINNKYTINELKLQILYCSKKSISEQHKKVVSEIIFFDYNIVQYFKGLTKIIKKSSKYEFFEFIKIPFDEVGENVKGSGKASINKFSGHILPEEKSNFNLGYKIVSFYIDAESLIKRAYVLRQEGWRDEQNIGYYQRMLEPKKITSMRKYLSEKDRVFINNIISTISEDKIILRDSNSNILELDDKGNFIGKNKTTNVTPALIEITDECNIIGLIDGQHRTYAYHEGDDQFEARIAQLRKVQNLLVTGILFPKIESKQSRLKFEANLFLEINSNQTNIRSQLRQEIELMISPFSSVAIAKRILLGLNQNGALSNMIEQYSFERGKIKTASIVSFGLKPLIKLEDVKSKDSLYSLWDNHTDKHKLIEKNSEEYDLLTAYIQFCIEKIRDLLNAVKIKLDNDKWESSTTPNGYLNVTFINGFLNVLRLLIENNKTGDIELYKSRLDKINSFDFKKYKSSQYRKMGQDIYDKYFK
jgi:DGQHR domain-containing protein